jgi:hypothetical protein
MDRLKRTMRQARSFTHDALIALEELIDLSMIVLGDEEEEEAEHVWDAAREALRTVETLKAVVDDWCQALPEQDDQAATPAVAEAAE